MTAIADQRAKEKTGPPPSLPVKLLNGLLALLKSEFFRRRLVVYLIAGFTAITFTFLLIRLMPGDPVQVMFAQYQGRLDDRAREAIERQLGFVDGPLHEQYLTYLKGIVTLDFGPSVSSYPIPVSQIVVTSLRWTLILVTPAILMYFVIGTLLGVLAAWRRGSRIDTVLLPISISLGAFPYFWIALLAVYFFGFQLDIFPTSHAWDTAIKQNWTSPEYLSSVIYHMIMPLFSIVLTSLGGFMLGMRNNMIGVLSQDYIVMAEAKGLADRRIMLSYAARNAILPSLTAFPMTLGFAVAGALFTEIVFSYPGMGYTLLRAINTRDYPLAQVILLMIIAVVLLGNFIVDISYTLLDPRAR